MILFEDKKIKRIAKSENVKMPDKYINTIDETLNSLEDNNEKKKIKPMWKYGLNFAIAMAILSFIVLPNLSPEIAYAMQEIPIVGNIVKVITIKNYFDEYINESFITSYDGKGGQKIYIFEKYCEK